MLILGGGPVGCELAQALARLGAGVTLVETGPQLLPREDAEAAALVAQALQADGVVLLTGHRPLACGTTEGQRWVEVQGAGAPRRLAYDELLVATGRRPRIDGLGLDALGLIPEGRLESDAFLRTALPSILVAGDLAGPYRLTNAAAHQATAAAATALLTGLWRVRPDDRAIPRVIFTEPELAQVGLTEAEAQAQGQRVEVTRLPLARLDRAVTDAATTGFVKVLTQPGRDRILGVTISGRARRRDRGRIRPGHAPRAGPVEDPRHRPCLSDPGRGQSRRCRRMAPEPGQPAAAAAGRTLPRLAARMTRPAPPPRRAAAARPTRPKRRRG